MWEERSFNMATYNSFTINPSSSHHDDKTNEIVKLRQVSGKDRQGIARDGPKVGCHPPPTKRLILLITNDQAVVR